MRRMAKEQKKIRPAPDKCARRRKEGGRGVGREGVKDVRGAVGRRGKRGEQEVGIAPVPLCLGHREKCL